MTTILPRTWPLSLRACARGRSPSEKLSAISTRTSPVDTSSAKIFLTEIGNLGGFVGPYAMGWLRDATGSFSAGLLAMAGLLVLATLMSWSLKLFVTQE